MSSHGHPQTILLHHVHCKGNLEIPYSATPELLSYFIAKENSQNTSHNGPPKNMSPKSFVVGMGTFFIYFSCPPHQHSQHTLQHLLTLWHQNQMLKVICKRLQIEGRLQMSRCNYITFGAKGLYHDTLSTATKSLKLHCKSYLPETVLIHLFIKQENVLK